MSEEGTPPLSGLPAGGAKKGPPSVKMDGFLQKRLREVAADLAALGVECVVGVTVRLGGSQRSEHFVVSETMAGGRDLMKRHADDTLEEWKTFGAPTQKLIIPGQ